MARRRSPAPPPIRHKRAEQMDLFPAPVRVERLDPRRIGAASSVRALYRVTIGHRAESHLVYHDRHGVYCEEHGKHCIAISYQLSAVSS